ncbi:MAG: ATP-binding protein [Methanimicrococcus sp.]|nr:ATP-binding protein [Methanimicrococcus sp.]
MFKVKAVFENLDSVIDFIEQSLFPYSLNPQTLTKIKIVAEEVFTNICRHAYSPKIGFSQIRIYDDAEFIYIEFQDEGVPFNPLASETPPLSNPLSRLDEGGFGILMMKNLVFDLSYQFMNHKNILTIITKKES